MDKNTELKACGLKKCPAFMNGKCHSLGWHCPKCGHITGCHVTFEEKCDSCGSDLTHRPAVDSEAVAEAEAKFRQVNAELGMQRFTPKELFQDMCMVITHGMTLIAEIRRLEAEAGQPNLFKEHEIAQLKQKLEAAEKREAGYKQQIDRFWEAVGYSWEIETREEIEKDCKENWKEGTSPLAVATHYMWKRDPKVEGLTEVVALGNILCHDIREQYSKNTDLIAKCDWHDEKLAQALAQGGTDHIPELPSAKVLMEAIQLTLAENGHLADGDDCTLIHLKRVMEGKEGGAK